MNSEFETYIETVNEIEDRIVDDNKYPIIRDRKTKRCCKFSLEFIIQNAKKKKLIRYQNNQFQKILNFQMTNQKWLI